MKNKIVLTGLLAIIAGSCSSPKYLPSVEEIDINQYGSHIRIYNNTDGIVRGELVAIDTSKIVVLTEPDKVNISKCVIVPVNEVNRFKLQFARQKHYGWTIPLYGLATISHGYFSIFTAPANLLVTISVTGSGENSFTYSDKNMTFKQLKMFARFPQGIPPGVDIADIK
jgi:hypothetical protein